MERFGRPGKTLLVQTAIHQQEAVSDACYRNGWFRCLAAAGEPYYVKMPKIWASN
jgi:hypothetical protein